MFLFFDTETTGLPIDPKASIDIVNNWPRLVQLAWLLYDNDRNPLSSKNYIIKPSNFSIPAEATRFHGISNAKAQSEGKSLKIVLKEFSDDINRADILIAHNMDFDERVVCAEFFRENISNSFEAKIKICTMKSSINFCAIQGPKGYKWPKLAELYYQLFKRRITESHNAYSDVNVTAICFWELVKIKQLTLPNIHNKNVSTMNTIKQAIFLKGFLESLKYNDTITPGQIEILISKLDELIETIEREENDNDSSEDEVNIPSSENKFNSNIPSPGNLTEPIDDLPF